MIEKLFIIKREQIVQFLKSLVGCKSYTTIGSIWVRMDRVQIVQSLEVAIKVARVQIVQYGFKRAY
jgi:hypothetical protein